MRVDGCFNTTFSSDEEAREYARAAKAGMTRPLNELPQDQMRLLRDWCITAELNAGSTRESAERRMLVMVGCVAVSRIFAAVLDHFGVLESGEALAAQGEGPARIA